MVSNPTWGEEVEPGDCEGEVPKLPLPGPPQPGVQAAAVHVDHHQDGGHMAEHVRLSIFKYRISFCRRKSLIDTIKEECQ